MVKRWKKLPGSRIEPAGMERKVLRKLPMLALTGTAALIALSLGTRLLWWNDNSAETIRSIQMIDIWVIAGIFLHWTIILTVSIYAFIVFVMKGPGYVADQYDLPDENSPR
jgi:hypothetical protein